MFAVLRLRKKKKILSFYGMPFVRKFIIYPLSVERAGTDFLWDFYQAGTVFVGLVKNYDLVTITCLKSVNMLHCYPYTFIKPSFIKPYKKCRAINTNFNAKIYIFLPKQRNDLHVNGSNKLSKAKRKKWQVQIW